MGGLANMIGVDKGMGRVVSQPTPCIHNTFQTQKSAPPRVLSAASEKAEKASTATKEEDMDPLEKEFGKSERVDIYCPLPKDLRDALAKLTPVDEVSARNVKLWLSGKPEDLKSFEEYAAMGLRAAGVTRSWRAEPPIYTESEKRAMAEAEEKAKQEEEEGLIKAERKKAKKEKKQKA